ncbi:MAG: mechanosensitive ion channel domain-containing protein [Cyanobacteria bacterium P01_A01_bin.84]
MSKTKKYKQREYFKIWKVILIILALLLYLISVPAIAEGGSSTIAQSPKAQPVPVTVDGRPIFLLKNAESQTAKDRVKEVNETLKRVIESDKAPNIKIKEKNNLPFIEINGKYLLTVTQNDNVDSDLPEKQAEIWKDKLITAINRARKERTAEFIRSRTIFSFLIVFLAVICHRFLGRLWKLFKTRITPLLDSGSDSSDQQQHQMFNLLLKATLFLARTALWVGITLYIANLFPLTSQWSFYITNNIITALKEPIVSPGQNNYSITDLLLLIGLFFGVFITAGSITNLLRSRVLQFLRISRGAQEAIAVIFKYGLIAIATVVLLQVWGIDLSSLAILASALGVGIGFGFQDIAKNFGSGIVLIFERPIQAGDFVEVGNYMGTVESIGARSVTIRTLDRISIIVPNSRFLESEVINWSHHNPISRIHLPVGVSYSSNPYEVKKALLEAAEKHPEVLRVPQPQVFFIGFGDNSLDFELLVWIDQPSHQSPIKSDLNFRIEASLRNYKIEVPFPQRDLHVRSGGLPLKLSSEVEEALMHMYKGANNKE